MEVKFKACEHLDYEPNYGNSKRQLISCDGTKVCWKRANNGDLVQFCKQRGRINHTVGCLNKNNAACSDYNEVEKIVEVPKEEYEN